MSLTPKQARFVNEYLVDLNATQAAIRAGYSPRTAASIGWENLRKPAIAREIAIRQEELAQGVALTQQEVLDGLRREANDRSERSSHSARVAAWVWLGKHLGMFPPSPPARLSRNRVDSGGAADRLTRRLELLSRALPLGDDRHLP